MSYLSELLESQKMRDEDLKALRSLREQIEGVLCGIWKTGDPRFYYGGSFGKRTMIREAFDLDIVTYFPPTDQFTVQAFYEAVETQLKSNKYNVERHNVALRLPYEGGFHIDVVPGKAKDNTYKYATLYASKTGTTKQTSIKVHIDMVRDGGNQDVIKLMKLWCLRHKVPIGAFALELSVAKSLYNNRQTDLAERLFKVLVFLRDDFVTTRLVDPANANNVISDEIDSSIKLKIKSIAEESCSKKYWKDIIW